MMKFWGGKRLGGGGEPGRAWAQGATQGASGSSTSQRACQQGATQGACVQGATRGGTPWARPIPTMSRVAIPRNVPNRATLCRKKNKPPR